MSSEVGDGSPPVENQFQPGRSGNPGGRPKGLARKVREVIGNDGDALVGLWSAVLDGYIVSRHPETGEVVYKEVSVPDRIAVSRLLAERGWGKAPAHMPVENDAERAERTMRESEDQKKAWEDFERELNELSARRMRAHDEALRKQVEEEVRNQVEKEARAKVGAAGDGGDNPPSAAN